MYKIRLSENKLNEIIKKTITEFFDKNSKYNKVTLVNDPKVRSGKDWATNIDNFPIKRNGKIFYVSRSVAVSLYCFCQNENGVWCILANQRGSGVPNNSGLWNVPCGFLSYNESAAAGAARECKEECGVSVPLERIKMQGVNSGNLHGAQNVSIRFAATLEGTTNDYPLSAQYSEPGEVSDIKWIPLSEVSKYKWAYGQENKVIGQAKTTLGYINGKIEDNLEHKINALKDEISDNPYATQLLKQILSLLKVEK